MNKKQRLNLAFDLQQPDRPPMLGGWLAAPEHIQTLTGCSDNEYWADPFRWGLEAEKVLNSDGIMGVVQPVSRGDFRIVGHETVEKRATYTMESVLAEIEALPEPGEMQAEFDESAAYAEFIADFNAKQAMCGDMLWCPADWSIIPCVLWSNEFGYETSMTTMALHPDPWQRLVRFSAERGRQRAILRARAIREGIHPRAILTGEDICSQTGPMVSPPFLRELYFPLVEYALEPLLEAGAKIVWHCDGDYRPLLDDVLACGVGGLQGFQQECGMDIEWIVDLRTREGDPLIIFGPVSVTTTLPHGTPDDVRAEVRRALDICRDKTSLVFFTSNTINPDIPLENIRTLWQTVLESRW